MNQKGKLYLIPAPLGEIQPLTILPLSVKMAIEKINHYIVEHEKNARRYIKSMNSSKNLSKLHFSQINKFTSLEEIPTMLDPIFEGHDMGIISDAGCPGIADPGAQIVELAHEKNIRVIPLVGPSSILLSLMASGLNGQNFAFHGYLPIDRKERQTELKKLERESKTNNQTQIFIETPYRNNQMLEFLTQTLHPQTRLCIACDLTLPTEFIFTASIKTWKKTKADLHKRPAVFLFLS